MPRISDHLDFLLRSSQDTLDGDKRLIDDWLQWVRLYVKIALVSYYCRTDLGSSSTSSAASALDDEWQQANLTEDSVLNIYRDNVGTLSTLLIKFKEWVFPPNIGLIASIEFLASRKANAHESLNTLLGVLSSTRPNDLISGEVIDVVGFDGMDLAMEILEHRDEFKQQVSWFNQIFFLSTDFLWTE